MTDTKSRKSNYKFKAELNQLLDLIIHSLYKHPEIFLIADAKRGDIGNTSKMYAKAFFEKLNAMELPEYFNWAGEIFEGLHVKERGDKTADKVHRNVLNLNNVGYLRQNYHLPVIVDPSHGSGVRELVPRLAEYALEGLDRRAAGSADELTRCVGEANVVARFGGDEFVVVLPGMDREQAFEMAEKIRAQMRRTLYLTGRGHRVTLRASFGVATFPEDAATLDELLALLNRAPEFDYTILESDLATAQWIVFALADVSSENPPSTALSRFLAERPDLFRQKNLVVYAFDAPYFLDATEVSKISAYYGLFSRIPQFVETAARVLFGEIPAPTGDLPVSVSGINYDLISATSPDPDQTIELFMDVPEANLGTPVPTPNPQLTIGDLIPFDPDEFVEALFA